MKIRYLLVLLTVVLLCSCAAQTTEPEPAAPEPEPEPEPITPEPEPAAPEPEPEPAAETVEIQVTYAGYEPSELTVAKGTILVFNAVQGSHKLTIDGKGQPNLEEGKTQEHVADKAGELRVFDIFTKKALEIQVTE